MSTIAANGTIPANGKTEAPPTSASVEVVYRGVFQKTLANRISRGVVLGARKDGKFGTAFARYGDSPERNGIPAKNFAVVATDQEELEHSLAKYEPESVDISVVVDDSLCKGIESWAWYGVQPINKTVGPGGTLIVTSSRTADELLTAIRAKDFAYQLVIIPAETRAGKFAPTSTASLSGLFAFNDDNTDFYALAAISRVAPRVISLDAVLSIVRERTGGNETRVEATRAVYDKLEIRTVQPGEGSTTDYETYDKPGWTDMRQAVIVDAPPVGARNPVYKKWSTRLRRPLINFETCIKCTQCWLQCPDESFEVTPEGTYEVVYEACIGCGVCAEVCPVPDCVTMHDELTFPNNNSLYELYTRDPKAYRRLLEEHAVKLHPELIDKAQRTPGVHSIGERQWPLAQVARGEE